MRMPRLHDHHQLHADRISLFDARDGCADCSCQLKLWRTSHS